MRILVLGAGNVGTLIARDLANEHEVWVGDSDAEKLKALSDLNTIKLDASRNLEELMKKFEFIVGALPGRLGFKSVKSAIAAKRNMVDVSFMPENSMVLDDKAKEAGVSIAVDAGFAPGLSNVLLGKIYTEMGELEEGIIDVGGLPKNPKPPMFYKLVFSPYDLLEEYTRPARIIQDGQIMEIDPLERIEEVQIENYQFESFVSDGLRTLLHTIKAKNMVERTLRWKGHLEKMKILKELGFLEKENFECTLKILRDKMEFQSDDFAIMRVYGRGEGEMKYFMYDEATHRATAMARSTGYMTAVISRLLMSHNADPGIIPPEKFGMNQRSFDFILREIRKRGITLKEYP